MHSLIQYDIRNLIWQEVLTKKLCAQKRGPGWKKVWKHLCRHLIITMMESNPIQLYSRIFVLITQKKYAFYFYSRDIIFTQTLFSYVCSLLAVIWLKHQRWFGLTANARAKEKQGIEYCLSWRVCRHLSQNDYKSLKKKKKRENSLKNWAKYLSI